MGGPSWPGQDGSLGPPRVPCLYEDRGEAAPARTYRIRHPSPSRAARAGVPRFAHSPARTTAEARSSTGTHRPRPVARTPPQANRVGPAWAGALGPVQSCLYEDRGGPAPARTCRIRQASSSRAAHAGVPRVVRSPARTTAEGRISTGAHRRAGTTNSPKRNPGWPGQGRGSWRPPGVPCRTRAGAEQRCPPPPARLWSIRRAAYPTKGARVGRAGPGRGKRWSRPGAAVHPPWCTPPTMCRGGRAGAVGMPGRGCAGP